MRFGCYKRNTWRLRSVGVSRVVDGATTAELELLDGVVMGYDLFNAPTCGGGIPLFIFGDDRRQWLIRGSLLVKREALEEWIDHRATFVRSCKRQGFAGRH